MRITCPSCSAAYEVPDALLGTASRRVRCARCAHEWVPGPPPTTDPAHPVLDHRAATSRPANLPATAAPPRGTASAGAEVNFQRLPPVAESEAAATRSTVVLWVLTLLAIAVAAWATVTWQGAIIEAIPASRAVFEAFGLHQPPP